MDMYTPEHPQSNGMCEKMMANLVKITHAAIAEGRRKRTCRFTTVFPQGIQGHATRFYWQVSFQVAYGEEC